MDIMAYDNYEDTPFDLNHDGHIDSNEAAYIYNTFYDESGDSDSDDFDFDSYGSTYSSGSYSSRNSKITHRPTKTIEELKHEEMRDFKRGFFRIIGISGLISCFLSGDILFGIAVAIIAFSIMFSIK